MHLHFSLPPSVTPRRRRFGRARRCAARPPRRPKHRWRPGRRSVDRVATPAAGARSLRGCARRVRSSRRRIPWRSSCRGIHRRLPLPLLRCRRRPKPHLRRPGRSGAAAGAGQRCRSCRGELPSSRREPCPPPLRRGRQLWSLRSCVSCGAGSWRSSVWCTDLPRDPDDAGGRGSRDART
jgi:hypothetical protein